MGNSPLVDYVKRSPMHSGPRNHRIDTITIHHMAGNLTVETCGQVFQTRQASANYGVDGRGRVGLYVDEANRAWSSANPGNDHRAVNIEVANCGGAPDWPVSGAAYSRLVELVADICRRNGMEKLVWSGSRADRVGHRNGCNMTVHQDFMATSCPGPYLLRRMPQLAADVNRLLGAGTPETGAAGRGDGLQGGPPAAGRAEDEAALPYTVRVEVDDLYIRSGPGTNCPQRGFIRPGVYTIVEESGGPGAKKWGRLRSGAGWIALDWVKRASV